MRLVLKMSERSRPIGIAIQAPVPGRSLHRARDIATLPTEG